MPAKKVTRLPAVLPLPPVTVESLSMALLPSPPQTLALVPLARLPSPPLTLAPKPKWPMLPAAMLPWPPLTLEKGEAAVLKRPPAHAGAIVCSSVRETTADARAIEKGGVASPATDTCPITVNRVCRADDDTAKSRSGESVSGPDHQVM